MMNPQEPPSSASAADPKLPTGVFDLFLDLPHPAASSERAKIIDPPVTLSPLLQRELFLPDNITRLSQFSFPEYDDSSSKNKADDEHTVGDGKLSSRGRTFGANLMKYDVYHVDFISSYHTFAILLSDGKTRVFGHVRRYLPTHVDSAIRMDVGRRRPRVLIILTRAMGGEQFYSSVLKTAEAVTIESQVNRKGCFAKKKNPLRSFLHALFNQHATLITQYAELRRYGLSLNFTQPASSSTNNSWSACDAAKRVMEENEDLFRVTLDKVEFGPIGKKKRNIYDDGGARMNKDILSFYLPISLQPSFECLHPREALPEDIGSPIIPLLRYVGPSHFIRLLSALLCERRIILISKSITRLSMCVRAASSVLAQGLLLWKHILIPIVPPHMLRFLSVKTPYLVGILHQYASRLGKIEGLTDALCVNLDNNELKTLSMSDPRTTVPDMLKRVNRKGSSDTEPSAVECLAKDLDEIVKGDQRLWSSDNSNSNHNNHNNSEKAKEVSAAAKLLDASDRSMSEKIGGTKTNTKPSFIEKMKHPLKKHVTNAKRAMSLEEKRQYATSVDAAAQFGKMIRKMMVPDDDGDEPDELSEHETAAPRYVAPSHDIDFGGVESCILAENEGGEEDVRAALTSFFMYMYGDMGIYLSQTAGTLWLDRRKFLLRKKQLGEKENSAVFLVLQRFSASTMFANHVKQRISDMSLTARDRASIMPHHIPLFDICSKYLSVHRLDYSLLNIRRIVARTVLACPRHLKVERHVLTRTTALALTADTPFDGNVTVAMSELVTSCHECNTSLSAVMAVIWHRLSQTKAASTLLALRLLIKLLSEGPLTAIIEGIDGASKIHDLKSYVDAKSVHQSAEVRQAADFAYGLLMDLSSLFARRQRIAFSKAQQLAVISSSQKQSWGDYLVSRLPVTTEGRKLHALFRPEGSTGRVVYDDVESVAPSVAGSATASVTPSVLALSRLRESRVRNGFETTYFEEEEEYDDDNNNDNEYFEGADEEEYMSSARPPQAQEEGFDYDEEQLPYGDTTDMLSSFNYAVSSSRGGSVFSASQTESQVDESDRSPDYYADRMT